MLAPLKELLLRAPGGDMNRRAVFVVVALAATLALPGRAAALDHVTLFVSPTSIAAAPTIKAKKGKPRPNPLNAWKLSAAVVGETSPGAKEIFGVSLRRAFMNGRAEELHGFRAAPAHTVSFDGRSGRWEARFGDRLTVSMAVTATGVAKPVGESQGCRGVFAEVPVELRGTFVLRTGTKFFKTIRSTRLAGSVTFNPTGPVDCTQPPSDSCTPLTVLSASHQVSGLPAAMMLMSPDSGGRMTLSFADRGNAAVDYATWYHVMRFDSLGFNPLAGELPTIAARMPATLSVRGSGTFKAGQSAQSGPCGTVSATGKFIGTFRTRFAGWGARTVRFDAGDYARYEEPGS
jgi:hypothetical protein